MSFLFRTMSLLLTLAFTWLTPNRADAQNLIRQPGAHTKYDLELEAHLAFADQAFGRWGWGPGLRASWVVADRGFIDKLNDSVAVGLGADFLFSNDTHCHGVGNQSHCHEDGEVQLLIPIAMQWNFWFTRQWSAFAEPGLAFRFRDHGGLLSPLGTVGGRLQLNSSSALTLRVGYPEVTLGASFFP